jgi:hypothetical protein
MPGTPGNYLSTLKLCDFETHPNTSWVTGAKIAEEEGYLGDKASEALLGRN